MHKQLSIPPLIHRPRNLRLSFGVLLLVVGLLVVNVLNAQPGLTGRTSNQPVTIHATRTAQLLAGTAHKSSTTRKDTTITTSPTIVSTPTSSTPTTTTATTSLPIGSVAPATSWKDLPLYVDPANDASNYAAANPTAYGAALIARMGQQPVAAWFGGWNSTITSDVSAYVSKAATAHGVPVLVAYNIPNRDCGGYSAGGAQTETDYASWIAQFANGIGSNPAVVILEPDAISLQSCLSADQLAARNRELSGAISTLSAKGQTYVYVDAGHSGWVSASDTAARLNAAGVSGATGFSLNVSNFETTSNNTSFGTQVSALIGGKHFVIDTSRNGNGPTTDSQWCNPSGRALGASPTTNTANSLVDAYLWIKTPWQSDGSCNGAPAAGADNWPYAISLAQAAGW